jgi:uncharacterized protein HemX
MDSKPQRTSLFKFIRFILLILVLAVIAWSLYDFEHRKSQSILGTLKLNVELITQLNAEQQALQQKIAVLQKTFNDSTDWKMREATELVLQADIQLRTQSNKEQAVYFLTSAKTLLDKADPNKVLALKQALTPLIAQLKQVKAVPLAEINQVLIKNQRLLPALIFTVSPNILPEEVDQNPPQSGWRASVQRIVNQFKTFIVVRKADAPLLPLLSKDMQSLAEQHLSALLTQTQGAALLQQDKIYRDNLQQILWLVEHYYDLKNQQTQRFLSEIGALQKINVQPAFPDVGPVLTLFIETSK